MYILFIMHLAYNGATTTTQEFANKQSCEKAISIITEQTKDMYGMRKPTAMFCIPKNKEGEGL